MEIKSKNQKVLNDFILYCSKHPEQRFWQALCNWSGYKFILRSNSNTFRRDGLLEDTFYIEGK